MFVSVLEIPKSMAGEQKATRNLHKFYCGSAQFREVSAKDGDNNRFVTVRPRRGDTALNELLSARTGLRLCRWFYNPERNAIKWKSYSDAIGCLKIYNVSGALC
ncbi:hypothetical protein SKAU_G00200380 [Synaphobranchus kaupii]|uniref:Uncharacterized protein n=1 Tax=Synaphobranchus kaupii TaxID=118154 RepID=A0A9Q1FFD1_SYNKA|nr:hypothetical protein SKAU_G00200380 [Synaphobranchus kaupii]